MKTSKSSPSGQAKPIKVNPAQQQQWSEQKPGYMPLNPTTTKTTKLPNANRSVGYLMRGARKSLKERGY
jgi:hypothetical protein